MVCDTNTIKLPKLTCFVCGSEDTEVAEEFDYFCSMVPTVSCICKACGASWYDDTIIED